MIYHVLPGDAQLEEFKKAGITGETIVFREALISGPIDADDIDTFWNERAHYILADYGEDEIEYKDKVVGEIAQLLDIADDDEVNLWFEYELFCSVNMWFCIYLLRTTKADLYRVEPIGLDEAERWDGFAKFKSDDLKAAFELRSKFTGEQTACGVTLWDAYRKNDLTKLSQAAVDTHECFPYLGEVVAAATEKDIRPLEVIREIKAGGENDFGKIFVEFKKRAGVYGYGDVQVQHLIDQLSSKQSSG